MTAFSRLSTSARSSFATVWIAAALGTSLAPSATTAQPAAPADVRAMTECVERAQDTGEAGANCIGLIAYPCRDKNAGDAATTRTCVARELAAWTQIAATAVKRIQTGGRQDVSAALAVSEKGWTQLRNKLCPVSDRIAPGTPPQDAAYCRMQTTAQRALLLRRLAEEVGER